MEYSVGFQKNFEYEEDIAEYYITFSSNYLTLSNFLQSMKEKNKRIVISMTAEQLEKGIEIDILKPFSNFIVIELPFILIFEDKLKIIEQLKNANINFYFYHFTFDWDTLYGLTDLGVSDVIISGELGFDLPKVSEFAKKKNIRVRVCPDVAQSSWGGGPIPSHMYFFIRPEDIDLYSQYIDVLFFNHTNQKVIYEVYAIKKKWFGDLRGIIGEFFEEPFDNRAVIPIFGERRLECKRRCKYGSGCHLCQSIMQFSNTLTENDLFIT